jgi:hypothetical protein
MKTPSLAPSASAAQTNDFLGSLQINCYRVHPSIIDFNDAADRHHKMTLLRSKLADEGMDKDIVAVRVKDLKEVSVISRGRRG